MGFARINAHKTHHHARATTPSADCTSGGFYKAPTIGATIDSLKPLVISWDPTCIDSAKLDIHLIAPDYAGDNNEITAWSGVTNSDAQKTVNMDPRWWNSTAQVHAQLAIVAAGSSPATAMLPAGPIFTATYDGSTLSSASDSTTGSIGSSGTSKSLPGGKTAAAVIVPLLFIGLAILAYLRYQRRTASKKSKRFSQVLDKRMSTISADWKSLSPAGATAAIRSSMAVDRASAAFSFGAIRPSMDVDPVVPHMKQVRTGTGVGLRNPGVAAAVAAERASRVSRVSFADTVGRPSVDSRRTRAGVAQSTYVIPPVPSRRDVVSGVPSVYPDSEIEKRDDEEKEKEYEYHVAPVSPRQTSGPLTLTPEDIQARMQGRLSPAPEKNEEYDEVMPALSLMRTTQDEYLLPQPPVAAHVHSPTSPHSAFTISAYAHPSPSSPASPSMPMPMPMMTPDDMLRAYAVRRSGTPTAAPSSFSSPHKSKGRKLSIRASLGMLRRDKEKDKDKEKERAPSPMISSPVPGSFMEMGGASGMAGVGTRMGGGTTDAVW